MSSSVQYKGAAFFGSGGLLGANKSSVLKTQWQWMLLGLDEYDERTVAFMAHPPICQSLEGAPLYEKG